MNHLDDDLRRALRRVDAPEGFADRLRTRLDQSEPVSPTRAVRQGGQRAFGGGWTLALAATLAIVAGGTWYRAEEQRRAQGEEAKRQVLLSLNIASSKLRAIEMKVNHGEDR